MDFAKLDDLPPLANHLESSSLLLPNQNGNSTGASDPIETLEMSFPSSEFRTPNADNQLSDSDDSWWGSSSQSGSGSGTGSSNCHDPGEPMNIICNGVGAGLINLGNTCFINSILQCFTHTVPLVELLYSCNQLGPCNCGNEEFCVIRNLTAHIKLAISHSGNCICPSPFVDNLTYFSSYFQRYFQEDAHEFLQSFLDKLEKCSLDSSNKNVVEQVFGGRLISKLRCCVCGSCSLTHEASVGLSLEIEDVDDLRSALTSFTQMEKLEDEFTCDNCHEKVSKEKQLMLDQAPVVATFHLKRFKNDGICINKIHKHVDFPLELNLEPFTVSGQSNDVGLTYHLYAVVEHIGPSLTSGHYFSYVRSSPGIWYKLDDSLVSRVHEFDVLLRDAYILFYARAGTPWFSSIPDLSNQQSETNASTSSPQSVLETASEGYVSGHTVDNSDTSRQNLLNPPEVPIIGCMANGNNAVDGYTGNFDWDWDFVSDDMEKECSTTFKCETNPSQHDDTSDMSDSTVSTDGARSTDHSPGQIREGSFQIPDGHLKSENRQEEASCEKSSAGEKLPEPSEIGITPEYPKKDTSSTRRELFFSAMGYSSPVKRTKAQETCSEKGRPVAPDTQCQP